MSLTAKMAWQLRANRGIELPAHGDYETPELEAIAKEREKLRKRLDELDDELQKLANPSGEIFQPGVYEYSGFGSGTYWCFNGVSYDCTRKEAKEMADYDGVDFVEIDRVPQSSSYNSNWRKYLVE